MHLGIFAKTFPGNDPAAILSACGSAGYPTAQFNWACAGLDALPALIPDEVALRVAAAVETTHIELAAVSGTYNMIHPDPTLRDQGARAVAEIIRTARGIGAPLVTLCTGTRNPTDQWGGHSDNNTPEAWSDLCHALGQALTLAEQAGVDLGIEPELANVVDSAQKAAVLIQEMQCDRLKVVFDPANLFEVTGTKSRREIVASGADLLGDLMAIAHAKDRLSDGRFTVAGRGVVDYPHYFNVLRQIGFDGPLIVHGLEPEDAPAVARFLREVINGALTT